MSSYLIISGGISPEQEYVMATYPSCNPLYTAFREYGTGSKHREITYKLLCEVRDAISEKLKLKNRLYEACRGGIFEDLDVLEDLISDISMLERSLHELSFLFTVIDHIETNSCDFNSLKCYID